MLVALTCPRPRSRSLVPALLFSSLVGTLPVGSSAAPLFFEGFEPPTYNTQTVTFADPNADFAFLTNSSGVNSWAGEDFGAVQAVGIDNNANVQGFPTPPSPFRETQGVVIVSDVADESINGAFVGLTTAFPVSEGGPGGSELPTTLLDMTVLLDMAFHVADPNVAAVQNVLGFWIAESDGDQFENFSGLLDLSREWNTYSFSINDLSAYASDANAVFGDSAVSFFGIQFFDPNGIDSITYFVDDFRIVPEPSTVALLGLALAGLAVIRGRHRRV